MPVFNNILAGAAGQTGGAAAVGPIKSVRFDKDSSGHLNRTFGTATDTKKFTISFWVKRVEFSQATYLLTAGTGTQGYLNFDAGIIRFYAVNGDLKTNAVFRDPAAWYHIVAVADTANSTSNDRLQLYVNGVRLTDANGDFATHTQPSGGATLGDWNSASTHYVNRLAAGNYENFYMTDFYFIDGQAKQATDFGAFDDNGVWQAAAYSGSYGTNGFHLFDFANESGIGDDSSGNDNDFTVNNLTDYSSSPNGSGSVTAGAPYNATYPWTTAFDGSINVTGAVGNTSGANDFVWTFGTTLSGTTAAFVVSDTYVSDFDNGNKAAINGTALTSSNWTKTTNTLPVTSGSSGDYKVYTVSLGGSNLSTVGVGNAVRIAAVLLDGVPLIIDSSGDNDVLHDVPANGDSSDDTGAGGEVSGNYCTWNPLDKATVTLANGNLDITAASTDNCVRGTIAVPESVKIYYEFTVTQRGGGGAQSPIVGVANTSFDLDTNPDAQTSTVWAYSGSGSKLGGGSGYTSYGSSLSAGDVLGVAIDRSAGRIWFSLNGTWQNSGDPTSSTDSNAAFTNVPTTGTLFIFFGNNNGTPGLGILNAGQRAFAYSAPTDYKVLCTTNLPTPTVADGSDYFDAVLYTGNQSTNSVTTGFAPDFLWLKNRERAKAHSIFDSVRGVNKRLLAQTNDEEFTVANTLTSFDSTGFTLGSNNEANYSGESHIAWAWDAGTSTVSNTDGTITSQVRANQTAGFSIVTYTGNGTNGATVGHGLNAEPDFVITKNRTTGNYWAVYPSVLNGEHLRLNLTMGSEDEGNYWSSFSSSVMTLPGSGSTLNNVNNSSKDYVSYCWSSVKGFSKFGEFMGNGNSDGPFIWLGFKPALIIVKGHDFASNWFIHDDKRPGYNVNTGPLRIAAEAELTVTTYDMDFLSNGFKMRTSGGDSNQSNKNFIYMAWASNPFQANGGLAR